LESIHRPKRSSQIVTAHRFFMSSSPLSSARYTKNHEGMTRRKVRQGGYEQAATGYSASNGHEIAQSTTTKKQTNFNYSPQSPPYTPVTPPPQQPVPLKSEAVNQQTPACCSCGIGPVGPPGPPGEDVIF
jgi:hypothetical protein